MKSLAYILITVCISSTLICALPQKDSKSVQRITLECVSDRHSTALLNKSADILASRLNDYGVPDADISVNEKLSSIDISFNKKVNLPEMIQLLLSKGRIEFYETLDRREVMHNPRIDKDSASILNINGTYYIYVLQPHAALNNSFISQSDLKSDLPNQKHELSITFDRSGQSIWREVTKRNIGKSIAIVLDKKILYAPIVRSEIKEGKCIITGDFSFNELRRINSLIKNNELPLEFKIKN
jgi:preprotein translocase subunit SecD